MHAFDIVFVSSYWGI